jgi:hypothetical protein
LEGRSRSKHLDPGTIQKFFEEKKKQREKALEEEKAIQNDFQSSLNLTIGKLFYFSETPFGIFRIKNFNADRNVCYLLNLMLRF